MLQKLLKCEVEPHSVEINIGKIWISKIAFLQFSRVWTLIFGIWNLKITQIYQNSKFWPLKVPIWHFLTLCILQIWFHVKSELQ